MANEATTYWITFHVFQAAQVMLAYSHFFTPPLQPLWKTEIVRDVIIHLKTEQEITSNAVNGEKSENGKATTATEQLVALLEQLQGQLSKTQGTERANNAVVHRCDLFSVFDFCLKKLTLTRQGKVLACSIIMACGETTSHHLQAMCWPCFSCSRRHDNSRTIVGRMPDLFTTGCCSHGSDLAEHTDKLH